MGEINSKFEIGVTKSPTRGSKKVHVGPLKVEKSEIVPER